MTGRNIILRLCLVLPVLFLVLEAGAETVRKPLPKDPELRTGVLPNGLSYYVRHNEYPKGQACFQLIQNSGSILEDENERGLAHFLEHMCFNGTKHFPGSSLMTYLATKGIKFGSELNAYTSTDETVYSINNMALSSGGVVDTCLMIIHDWCDALELSDEEIEKERGVIKEEWRGGRGATTRMYDSLLPAIFGGSLYAHRLPIGKMEVVENFKPETLRSYYRKWSRPDLQSVVVVGDIDADEVVAKIQAGFADMKPASADAPQRFMATVPDNGAEPVIAFAHDAEQEIPMVYLYKKQSLTPKEDKDDEDYYWMLYIQQVMNLMISHRLDDILKSADSPWLDAAIGESPFYLTKTKGSWMGVMTCQHGTVEPALEALYREMKRIELHGFTAAEYDRARKVLLGALRKRSVESTNVTSAQLCQLYAENYLDGEPVMSPQQEYEMAQKVSEAVDLGFVNFYCRLMPKDNFTVFGFLPQDEAEPDVKAALARVDASDIEAYQEPEPVKPLMETLPPQGPSAVCKGKAPYGYTRYVLGNGATVYVRNTDFNPNQIQIRCYSPGGTSLYGDEDLANLREINSVLLLGGLGKLNSNELSRALAGKQVSLTPEILTLSEGLYGASTVEDFEDMLQLTHLCFTDLRRDSTAFAGYLTRMRSALRGSDSNIQTALNDTINTEVYGSHPRARRLSLEDLDAMDYNRMMDIAAERFANAADFTFIFTGHFDYDSMMPLIERYIGSLPSQKGRHEKYVDRRKDIVKGRRTNAFEREMETPMAASVRIYSAPSRYTLKENIAYEVMGQCLNILMHREIRENQGGTYSIRAKASLNSDPKAVKSLQIVYQCDPERRIELDCDLDALLELCAEYGPDPIVLDEVKEHKRKNYVQNQSSNAWCSTVLREYLETGVDFCDSYLAMLDSITVADVAAQLRGMLKSGNDIRVILTSPPAVL